MNPKELAKFKFAFFKALLRDRSLSATDLGVAWLLLFEYLNAKSMTAWPSAETLAADLEAGVRTVRRSTWRLTRPGGYFKLTRGGKRRHSNTYAVNSERLPDVATLQAQETLPDVATLTEETVPPVTVNPAASGQKTLPHPAPDTFEVNPLRSPLRESARARGPTNSHSGEGTKTKIDPAWQPRLAECNVGYDLELDDRAITFEADKFRDYYLGNGEKREDWNAVFRTWLRRSPSFEGRGQGRASANTEEQDRASLRAALGLDQVGGTWPANGVAAVAEVTDMVERRDRRRVAELRQKIQWFEGQETKLDASFATPIAEAKAELEGILSRSSGEGHA